ncbi:MAG: TRAP transporter small permease [Alphaproteobacteria bacterium]|nr:MAG: TRAP transporter small permease [Alphaproteobacteria bacterium]
MSQSEAAPDGGRGGSALRITCERGLLALAAACLVGLLGMILVGIAGGVFGFFVRGLDAYAGYLMAASISLALAATLTAGEHIRVTLVLERLSGLPRRVLDVAALAVGTGIACWLAYAALRMAWLSWDFHEVSSATDATPLWIPQAVFALGFVALATSFLMALVESLAGRAQQPSAGAEPLRVE